MVVLQTDYEHEGNLHVRALTIEPDYCDSSNVKFNIWFLSKEIF